MKQLRTISVRLLLAGILLTIAPLPAQEQNPPPPPVPMVAPILDQLSAAQREQLRSIQIKHLKEILPLQTELSIKELEFDALWDADKLDTKAILAKAREIAELRSKLELAKVNHQLEVAQLLTPEQRRQLRHRFGPQERPGRGMGRRMLHRHRCREQAGPDSEEPNCCPKK